MGNDLLERINEGLKSFRGRCKGARGSSCLFRCLREKTRYTSRPVLKGSQTLTDCFRARGKERLELSDSLSGGYPLLREGVESGNLNVRDVNGSFSPCKSLFPDNTQGLVSLLSH